jgi:hypothetical protein
VLLWWVGLFHRSDKFDPLALLFELAAWVCLRYETPHNSLRANFQPKFAGFIRAFLVLGDRDGFLPARLDAKSICASSKVLASIACNWLLLAWWGVILVPCGCSPTQIPLIRVIKVIALPNQRKAEGAEQLHTWRPSVHDNLWWDLNEWKWAAEWTSQIRMGLWEEAVADVRFRPWVKQRICVN